MKRQALLIFTLAFAGFYACSQNSDDATDVISDDIQAEDTQTGSENSDLDTETPAQDTSSPDTAPFDTGPSDTGSAQDDSAPVDTDDYPEPSVVYEGPGGKWARHVINEEIGESIMLRFVPNLCGDGALKAIGANHTNTKDDPKTPESQVVLFDVPTDPVAVRSPWPMRKISEGIVSRKSPMGGKQGAPGIFGFGDADMDGDIDILVSGDGDANIYVIEQTSPCEFETRVLATAMGQAGVMLVEDIDKDGVNELIVSSYEANAVKAYEWKFPATVDYKNYGSNFEQHVLSDRKAPAFGTAADVNKDGHLDLIISHYAPMSDLFMKGELVLMLGSGNLDKWDFTVIDNDVKFPHKSSVKDMDGDGDLDIFHPSGFLACEANPLAGACGSIAWYENDGGAWRSHSLIGPKNKLFFFDAIFDDYDGDGVEDFITVGERMVAGGKQEAQVLLFKGSNTDDLFSGQPVEIGQGLGSLPEARDIDGDGDLDLFSAEYFLSKKDFPAFSFAWFEQLEAPKAD